MLTTVINSPTKFLLIVDSLEEDGKEILNYLLDKQEKQYPEIHYFIFNGDFERRVQKSKIKNYDFTSDIQGWLSQDLPNFKQFVEKIKDNCVIVINSLAHMILQYDVSETYKLLNYLKQKPNVLQVSALLHIDLLQNPEETLKFFEHLSTLIISREPRFNSINNRISYVYKKPGGKIIKQIEEYYLQNGNMVFTTVKKVDPKALVEQNINQTLPSDLTTFRISLSEKEKESRSKVVLPYLPKNVTDEEKGDGKIIYKFDDTDDWDEEDPDDDLDI